MARRGGIGLIAAASALSTFILPALADEARRPQPGDNGRSPAVNYMTQCQGCHLPGSSWSERVRLLALV